MKKQISMFLAAAMGLAIFTGPAAAQGSGSVVILRGAAAETVRFDNRSGVTVARGQPAAKPVAPVHGAAHSAAYSSIKRVRAGNTLWIIDGSGKRLVACRVRSTTQVGGRRIRCISRALPAALR